MRSIDFEVMPSDDGITAEKYLVGKGFSRRMLTRLRKAEGLILRNGESIRTTDILNAGDTLTVNMSDEKYLKENGDLNIPIVYENDDVVVFDKPWGVPVHPSIRHYNDTLGNYFAYLYKELTFRPVNRLDKDTSGLCVVAKNPYAAAALANGVEKMYFAIVGGNTEDEGVIDAPIARDENTIIGRRVHESGQKAVTRYETLQRINGVSFLKIWLETGRTHQIRVHFSHIGHPLAGDELYGGDCARISRHALHCGEVSFISPVTKERVTVTSDIPADMSDLLKDMG